MRGGLCLGEPGLDVGDRLPELAAACMCAGGGTARRVTAAADHDAARVRKVAGGGDGRPAGGQPAPTGEQGIQVGRQHGAREDARSGRHGDPVRQCALARHRGQRLRTPVILPPGVGGEQAGGAARVTDLPGRVIVGPQQRALELATHDRLDGRPRLLGGGEGVQQRRPAGRGEAAAEARGRVVRLRERRKLGARRLKMLGELDDDASCRVRRFLRLVPSAAGDLERRQRGRRVARSLVMDLRGQRRRGAQLAELPLRPSPAR